MLLMFAGRLLTNHPDGESQEAEDRDEPHDPLALDHGGSDFEDCDDGERDVAGDDHGVVDPLERELQTEQEVME